jgi:2-polyprenyl-6-methoxyphenol hydroxylase-like FAD-dependent oxidoreductase
MSLDEIKRHLLKFHAGWHDPIPRLLEAAENITVTATLDVATLPTWWRGRVLLIGDAAHATSPHAGQGASLALEDAMRLGRIMRDGQELDVTFQTFENERRPRAERIVAFARRNGNQKGEFSPLGAWFRDQMLRLLIRANARGMNWMYGYDPRTVESTSQRQISDLHDRQAA